MQILIVSTCFPPAYLYGGPPLTAFGKANALQQLGHKVLVVTTNANGNTNLERDAITPAEFLGIPVIRCDRWHANRYYYASSLKEVLRQNMAMYDVALVQGNWSYVNLIASRVCSSVNMPYVLYPEGTFSSWALSHHQIRKRVYWHLIERQVYRKTAAVVALTETEAQQVRMAGVASPVAVISNGVFLEHYSTPQQTDFYGSFPQLSSKDKIILYMGRIHKIKGLEVLLAGFAQFTRANQTCKLIIAGDGSENYLAELNTLVQSLSIQDRVSFVGAVESALKQALLKRADLFTLMSYSEGFSMAVLEALACGTPVLISPGCNFAQVSSYGAGIIAEPEPDNVSRALTFLMDDDQERQEMGRKARELVEQQFTWARVAEETVELCQRVLDAKDARRAA
jgi:glycosyltransferase involved in cell wall biosynthesis